jgi:alkylated DNA repair dioxygenase AlkB
MDDLFGNDDALPSGLVVWKHRISTQICDEIVKEINKEQWFTESNQYMRFGDLPLFLEPLKTIPKDISTFDRVPVFNQLIANFYDVGEGLNAHVDLMRFEDGILVASLQGTCTMVFQHVSLSLKHSVFLEPGDVILLTGSSRWDWTHAIPAQSHDVVDGIHIPRTHRISITLRRMKLDENGLNI